MTLKCKNCNREFATPRALSQHQSSKHGSNKQTAKAPAKAPAASSHRPDARQQGRKTNADRPDGTVVRTHACFLGTATVDDKMGAGTEAFVWQVAPEGIADSWVRAQCRLYQRWRPKRMTVRATSGLGITAHGLLGLVWIPDINLIDAGAQIAWYASQPHRAQAAVRDDLTLRIPCETEFKWLDTDARELNGTHGYVILYVISPLGGFTGDAEFMLTLDAELELSKARVPSSDGGGAVVKRFKAFEGLATVEGSKYACLVEEGASAFTYNVVYGLEPDAVVKGFAGDVPCGFAVRSAFTSRPQVWLFETVTRAMLFNDAPSATTLRSEGTQSAAASTVWKEFSAEPIDTSRAAVTRQRRKVEVVRPGPMPRVAMRQEVEEAIEQTAANTHGLGTRIERIEEELREGDVLFDAEVVGDLDGVPVAGALGGNASYTRVLRRIAAQPADLPIWI